MEVSAEAATTNVLYVDEAGEDMQRRLAEHTPPEATLHLYQQARSVTEQRRMLEEADCLLVATKRIDEALIKNARALRLIQKTGTGTDNIDLGATASRGIPVANTAGANAIGVAELTILFILGLYRKLLEVDSRTRKGEWPMWEFRHTSFELSGKTHGIVGFGAIGQEVARRSAAFGTEVIYHDAIRPEEAEYALGARPVSLAELLSDSDIVSLHVPLVEETRNLIGAHELGRMKPEALLVNSARGGIVDEAALHRALVHGEIAGAALDVWDREPVSLENPLLDLSNVIATPHVGAGTLDTLYRVLSTAFENVGRVVRGERPEHIVNGVIPGSYGTRMSGTGGGEY